MNIPEWLKPALIGAGSGERCDCARDRWILMGGWVTQSTAKKMASEQAELEVTAALVPLCVERSRNDPRVEAKLAKLNDTESHRRAEMMVETGWAAMPGSSDPDRSVARACLDQLIQ